MEDNQVQLPPHKEFIFRNAMYIHHLDKTYYDYDITKYVSEQDWLNPLPFKWKRGWGIRFLGATQEQIDNQNDLYIDPREYLIVGQIYALVEDAIIHYDEKLNKCVVILNIYGLSQFGKFNPDFFETLEVASVEMYHPFEILLKDPPKELPDIKSKEYIQLFKETAGTVSGRTLDENIYDNFDYIGYIKVTRKPEQYPDWLTEMIEEEKKPSTAIPRSKPKIGIDNYFEQKKPNPFST
tara:strand:+ start:261 stop:974 length:714 start_codon:yes stop_codon:yes gene_type:complete